jgi:hypothetical protein
VLYVDERRQPAASLLVGATMDVVEEDVQNNDTQNSI